MILILAGTYRQARWWAETHGFLWDKDVMYVDDYRRILGIKRGLSFVRVGTWDNRPFHKTDRILEQFKIHLCAELNPDTLEPLDKQ